MILLAFLCCLLAVPLLLFYRVPRNRERRNLPPSPPSLPVIGNLHQFGKLPHRAFRRLASKYGPLMYLHAGYMPMIIVSNAEMAEEILKTHDAVFCTRPVRAVISRLSYGGLGVASARYGEGWRQLRKIVSLQLFTPKRVESIRHVLEEEVRFLVKTISETAAAGEPINVSDMVLCLFNNITCRQAFGIRCSNDGDCRRSKFHDQIGEAVKLIGVFAPSDIFPNMGWLDKVIGLHFRLEKVFRFFDNFLEEQIEAHLMSNYDDEADFLCVLLRLQRDGSLGFNLTREQIKILLLETFLAGSDTSASVTVFAMLELLLNPRVMKKAQEEVRRVVGRKPMADESDIADLSYLRLVVKETLRLHPPAPFGIPHESMKGIKIGGYDIPAKTVTMVNFWAIMRDPESWKDAEVFHPERFEENDIQYKGQDFRYLPFSSGRRSCPGLNLGVVTVEYTLANILHCFNWELPDGIKPQDVDTTETFGVVVELKSPLLLKAVPFTR